MAKLSKVVKNIVTVVAGTAGAQLITLLAMPLITRIYSPEAFGVLGTFVAALALITPIAALCYPLAIVIPRRTSDTLRLVGLSIRLSLLTCVLLAVLLGVVGGPIASALNLSNESYLLWWLLPAVLASVLIEIGYQLCIRFGLFSLKSRVVVLASGVMNGAKIGAGLIISSATTLVIVTAVTLSLKAAALMSLIAKSSRLPLRNELSAGRIPVALRGHANQKSVALEYSDFPKYRAPQITLSALSKSLPVIMLSTLFSPAVAGMFVLANTVLKTPIQLISKAVSDVYLPIINKTKNSGDDVRALLLKTCGALFMIGIAPFVVLMFIAPEVFQWVFGSEWRQAGSFASWLAVTLLFSFAGRPCIAAIPILKWQREFLVFEVVSVIAKAAALWIGYVYLADAIQTIALYSLVYAALNILLTIAVIMKAKTRS